MAEVNQTNSASIAIITAFIQRLDAIQGQHNRQIDALKAELSAMLPESYDQARYQKLRLICSSRKLCRDFRDGRIKL